MILYLYFVDYSNNKIKPLVDIMLDFQMEENFDESYIIDEIRTFFYAVGIIRIFVLKKIKIIVHSRPSKLPEIH